MGQPLLRVLLLVALIYGLYRVVPVVKPEIEEAFINPGTNKGLILGKATDYLERIFTADDRIIPEGDKEIQGVVNDAIESAGESLSGAVQTDLNKAKDSVKEITNEQFCRTILKTVEEQCGKYYCE